jgi:3-dehydro-L-gulonate 2-dehydrogenase
MLTIGAWKGAGLGLVLDMLATLVTGGFATHELSPGGADGTGYSQVFVALDPSALPAHPAGAARIVDAIVDDFHQAEKIDGRPVFYPGERTLKTRAENMAHGIPLDPEIWRRVQAL